jgi:superfamily I DNA and/or RNA helicase
MNLKYVIAVRYILQALIHVGVTKEQIELLTFYKTQLNIYQALISSTVKVMTVDSSQRREFDFVIVNLVTSSESDYSLSFLTNSRKINVVLSRIKIELVIVDNKEMRNIRFTNVNTKIWKDIVKNHELNETVHDLTLSDREVKDRFEIFDDLYQDAQRDRR